MNHLLSYELFESKLLELKTDKNTVPLEPQTAVRLRTLTLKSKLGFGQYNINTIQDIINLGKSSYLRRCYYTFSSINFTEDVLRMIGILGNNFDYRIEKPGVDEEMINKANQAAINNVAGRRSSYDEEKDFGVVKKIMGREHKSRKRAKYVSFAKQDSKKFSKGNLARINQGH